jgi:hypothetical protein
VTIVFDFVYQVTLFVAFLVLDERRITKSMRMEQAGQSPQTMWEWCCCCCFGGSTSSQNLQQTEQDMQLAQIERQINQQQEVEEEFFMDRFMKWYACHLLRHQVKATVLVVFLALMAASIFFTSQLTQEFNVEDYVPQDSYTQPFLKALDSYSTLVVPMAAYFRNVDQSDPDIQQQMRDFIDDIVALPQVGQPPEYCWVRDMQEVLNSGQNATAQISASSSLAAVPEAQKQQLAAMSEALQKGNFTFEEKVEIVLNIPGIRDVYGEDVVRDEETGEITASRCYIFVRHLDIHDINEQIDMLLDQREVTMEQPINQLPEHQGEIPFFTFDGLYYYWQLVRSELFSDS